ncbi:griselysin [Luteimonas cucumeris]|uniref:Neutral metalloproteinase n=1 Tax=Luteimonas cucumeris TaxID=985012 RepID=A0A562L236_9GAMM|nr:M4 family metallopeptidase [Luteimonas cucumeris]TWI01691.1 griselysin [Luteimonas cucumeris]
MQSSLLSAAVVSALALSATAVAGDLRTSSPVVRAQGLLNGPATSLVRRDSADQFIAKDVVVDRNGNEHVRFARTYRGLPVIGGGIVVHSRNNQIKSVTQTLDALARPNIVPTVDKDWAIVEAGARLGSEYNFTKSPTSRTVIYARGDAAPKLAYEVRYQGVKKDQTPTDMHVIVDAHNGKILDKWDRVYTAKPGPDGPKCANPTAATGVGDALYLGEVELGTGECSNGFQLIDPTRGGGWTSNMGNRTVGLGTAFVDSDNVWGNGTNTNSQTVAVDAHFGVSSTWDYFLEVHGRAGIANDGKGALSRVHYGRNYANANWSDACFCMTFGDGNGSSVGPLVELDVAGHEMSHGVTSRTADLIYSGESGGLNEATSDIFGAMVEYRANTEGDTPDYLIGELVFRQDPSLPYQTALRYMFKPSLDGLSPDCWSPDIGGIDVHYSSGVANHFFYLLAEGAVVPDGWGEGTGANLTAADLVCNGNTELAGIGRADAEQIWYLALTGYMVEDTDYPGARVATLSAATDLFGADSPQYAAVAAAWSAVSVE